LDKLQNVLYHCVSFTRLLYFINILCLNIITIGWMINLHFISMWIEIKMYMIESIWCYDSDITYDVLRTWWFLRKGILCWDVGDVLNRISRKRWSWLYWYWTGIKENIKWWESKNIPILLNMNSHRGKYQVVKVKKYSYNLICEKNLHLIGYKDLSYHMSELFSYYATLSWW